MKNTLLEIIYIIAGLIAVMTAVYALNDDKHPSSKGTALFWGLLGFVFIVGKYIPAPIVGAILLFMGCITAMKKVSFGSQENAPEVERVASAKKLGNILFLPALTIGLVAFFFGQYIKSLGGLVGLGAGAVLATLFALGVTKSKPSNAAYDGSRLLQQIGSASILPQLLAALGSLFAAAGVGQVISGGISGIITEGNILAAVVAYCLGMAVFTMIMGNAFAAFAVITAGIGMPLVMAQGANPAVAGILALTAGYCGTLMTPMAANFNIVPAAVLETENKYRVILSQLPFALILWVVHVLLMYTLAF
tara:strand:- start:161 stop:1078 length:918 start_codon:yes stop_codon:yes gene_type:complete